MTLSRCMTNNLCDYVAYVLPNEEDKWDTKISYFERIIDFLKFISGILNKEKVAGFGRNIAMLYRYMATYYVAQGKKNETLTSLENMLLYLEKDVYGTSDKGQATILHGISCHIWIMKGMIRYVKKRGLLPLKRKLRNWQSEQGDNAIDQK